MPQGAQEPGGLPAMMRSMIHHVQDYLEDRSNMRDAFQIVIGDALKGALIREVFGPLEPSGVKARPICLEHAQVEVTL